MSTTNTVSTKERDFFNHLIEETGEFDPFAARGWKTLRTCFLNCLSRYGMVDHRIKMVDIGCGTGMSKQIYDGFYEHYTGVDLSEAAIARAKSKFTNESWIVADACALPFDDESFDLVAFSSVLHHIPDYSLALNEAYRILVPGGVVFAFDPNVLHPAMALLRHPNSPFYVSTGVSPNERPLNPKSLRQVFADTGFQKIFQRCQSNLPYRYIAPRFLSLFLRAYNALDYCWETVGLGRKFGLFIISAGQKTPQRSNI